MLAVKVRGSWVVLWTLSSSPLGVGVVSGGESQVHH